MAVVSEKNKIKDVSFGNSPSGFSDTQAEPSFPNSILDFNIAKRFLKKMGDHDESLWELLTNVLQKAGEMRGEVGFESFQKIIRALIKKQMNREPNVFRRFYIQTYTFPTNIELCKMYRNMQMEAESGIVDSGISNDTLTFQKMKLLAEANVGWSMSESYNMMLALRKFVRVTRAPKARVWGKIFGMKKNYYVIEAEPDKTLVLEARARDKLLSEEAKASAMKKSSEMQADADRASKTDDLIRAMKEEIVSIKEGIVMALTGSDQHKPQDSGEGQIQELIDPIAAQQLLAKYIMPPNPRAPEVAPVIVPSEILGSGVNTKRYYVANEPWEEFVQLPDSTPAHIVTARCLTKYFTGDLEAPVISYPEFPGVEKHLLRSQIARISAGTMVCPVGVFTVSGGEEEAFSEEDLELEGYMENDDYRPPPIKRLVQRNYWMHIRKYILPQGRTEYWKVPGEFTESEGADDWDEEELRLRLKPPILSLISRDDHPDIPKCWSIRRPYRTAGTQNCITVRSNVWPGAHAVNRGFVWENIYIGWGVKYVGFSYGPPPVPFPKEEYEIGIEVIEILDPTPEAEDIWRKKRLPPVLAAGFNDEYGEGEEGEEEDIDYSSESERN